MIQVVVDPVTRPGSTVNSTFPTIGSLINVLLRNSLTIIGIILLFLLLFGGLQYIISAGSNDPKKTAQSQAIITDALIGFAVVFLAYFIIQIVQIVTGLNILNPTL